MTLHSLSNFLVVLLWLLLLSGAYAGSWGSIEPTTPSWKAADPEQWQLSSYNGKEGVDMACIRGAEQALGPWRIVRQMESEVPIERR